MTAVLRHLSGDAWLLFGTRFIRLFAYGGLSVVLVLYLVGLGLSESDTGLLLTCTLLGDTLVSLYLTTQADRDRPATDVDRRRRPDGGGWVRLRVDASAVAADHRGNDRRHQPERHEVGPFLPIEQAALSQVITDRTRTDVFAWYTLTGSFATALGALAAGNITDALEDVTDDCR